MAEQNFYDLTDGHDYHVFISHSHKDVAIMKEIKQNLEGRGMKCCDPESDFFPGSSVDVNITISLRKSKKMILVASKEFLDSVYSSLEIGLAIQKEGQTKRVTIIPVIVDIKIEELPTSLRTHNALTWREPEFWTKLYKALEVEELSALVPAGDIAHGLAWSYFYGYLKLVLPGMKERVRRCDLTQQEENKGIPFLDKMMIILPESGFCPSSLKNDDENVVFAGFINFKASRAGNIDRDYKSSVYRVTHPVTNEKVLVIAEFATPLMSMYEMETDQIAGLDKEEKIAQKHLFDRKLLEILESPNNKSCNGAYLFLPFKDTRDNEWKPKGWRLSELIAERALNDLKQAKQKTEVEQEMERLKLEGTGV